MSILKQDLLTLDFWQDKVMYGKHTVPIGTGRADTSRLPARSVLQNASHFEVSTGDPRPLALLCSYPSALAGTKRFFKSFRTHKAENNNTQRRFYGIHT